MGLHLIWMQHELHFHSLKEGGGVSLLLKTTQLGTPEDHVAHQQQETYYI